MLTKKVYSKLKFGFYTLLLVGAVFGANQMDKNHFETAQYSLNSIYKDRVVAQDIIYQLSSSFNDRHLLYITDSTNNLSSNSFERQDKKIENLLERFKETELTDNERKQLLKLERNYESLKEDEAVLVNSSAITLVKIQQDFVAINENLDRLSAIQLSESRSLKVQGQKSLDNNYLMSITELILLVIAGIVLLVITFYKGS